MAAAGTNHARRRLSFSVARAMTTSNQRTQGGKTMPFSEGQFVMLGPRRGGVTERTLVLTVTVAVMGVLPSSVTLAGAVAQVESGVLAGPQHLD